MTGRRFDLEGKVVLITGGTGGIGSSTAQELLRRGARVAVTDVASADPVGFAAKVDPARCWGGVADVRDRAAMDRVVEQIVDRFGRLDVAIANAGVLTRSATLRASSPEATDRLLAVNINGVINTVGAALEQVIEQRGHVVLLSSVFAYLNGMGTIPYAMSKAAVEQLGRGLRVELAGHGVSTTVVYFSLIQTPMISHGLDTDPEALELLSSLPSPLLKRLRPEVAAHAIVDGIERRAPRVMQPPRWKPLSAMRGMLGPALDAYLVRDRGTLDILARLDSRREQSPTSNVKEPA